MTTFIIHATCHYTTKNVVTGEHYSASFRPTISVKAQNESLAIQQARRTEERRMRKDKANELISFSLTAEVVNEI
jgi:hypothetical protein